MNVTSSCLTGAATILTCRKIAQSFSENIYELSSIRRNWSPDYAESLMGRINKMMNLSFTREALNEHLEKHNQFYDLMVAALRDTSIFRAELKVDFKHDKDFLKKTFDDLGYTDYFSDAKNGDHYSLYKMILTFKENMSSELELVIIGRGINKGLINRIKSHHKSLEELKACFDPSHDSDLMSKELMNKINAIYSEIKDICRIANAYYEFDPIQRDKFSFYKVMINLKKNILSKAM
jgi:hypothetical protein